MGNCVPVMRTQLSRIPGQICKIKGVPACAGSNTVNCNTWKLTYDQCQTRCFNNPKCIGFSFTDDEWNLAHSAGCVVWDEKLAAACDAPHSEKSWSTYMLQRDNLQGCFTGVASSLPSLLSDTPVSWQRCKELTDVRGYTHFAVTESKDGLTGKCVAGSGIADDYKVLSHQCFNACTAANGCTRVDGSSSIVNGDGHRVSAGKASSVYSIPVLSSKSSGGTGSFMCYSKGTQSVSLDCSSNLKFKDYHSNPAK